MSNARRTLYTDLAAIGTFLLYRYFAPKSVTEELDDPRHSFAMSSIKRNVWFGPNFPARIVMVAIGCIAGIWSTHILGSNLIYVQTSIGILMGTSVYLCLAGYYRSHFQKRHNHRALSYQDSLKLNAFVPLDEQQLHTLRVLSDSRR